MAEKVTKLPVEKEKPLASTSVEPVWRPFESLRQEIDRIFEDFGRGFWPSWGRSLVRSAPEMTSLIPAVDVVESERAFEITADLPGMEKKNVEVKLAYGALTIKGEKQESKEEKQKDYYRRERSYGALNVASKYRKWWMLTKSRQASQTACSN